MTEEKRLFPAQEKSEKVLDIIRKHWFVYFIFWLIVLLMSIPVVFVIVFWISSPERFTPFWINILILFGPIYSLFILGLLIYGFTDFYLDIYVVTDRRVVDISQNGFFRRTISELNVTEIQDVNAEVNGFMATLLHFGNVHIQTASEKPNFVFELIPHPYEVSKKILDLHQTDDQKKPKKEKEEPEADLAKITKLAPIGEKNESEGEITKITKVKQKEYDDKTEDNESCYSEETCKQKILEGLNKHVEEDPSVVLNKNVSDKEGELKEGQETQLQ